MSTSTPTSSSFPFRLPSLTLATVLLLLAGGGYAVWTSSGWFGGGGKDTSQFTTETARRGSLRVTVTERGQTASLSNVTLSSKVEGSSTIITIVPEGTQAQPPVLSTVAGEIVSIEQPDTSTAIVVVSTEEGEAVPHEIPMVEATRLRVEVGDHVDEGEQLAADLLCELDSSVLQEEYKEEVIQLKQAEADLVKAKANVTIQRSQNLSDEAAADLAETIAELDLKKYLGTRAARRELERFLAKEKRRNSELDTEFVLSQFDEDDQRLTLEERYARELGVDETVDDENELTSTGGADSGSDGESETVTAARPTTSDVEDVDEDGEGEFAQQRNELLGQVTVAEEDLARAREVFEFTKRLARKGYKSLNDVEADRIAVTKARIALSVAREKLGLLDEFTRSRTAEEMLANFVEAVAAKSRTKISGDAAYEAFEKELEARVNALEIERSQHDRLEQQLEACLLFAPSGGVVVYANEHNRRSADVVIEEGGTVRERQAVIHLPDLERMKVDAQIHESRISLLDKSASFASLDVDSDGHLGPDELPEWTWSALTNLDGDDNGRIDFDEFSFPVSLRIDAYPGERFLGRVATIASVPSPSDWMRPNLKQYSSEIEIVDARGRELKPGMTAVVEVLVNHREDALQVPVQSIVSVGETRYCWVLENGRPVRRTVRIGASSATVVEITEGVEEGEEVVMNPRTHFAKELEELKAASGKPDKKPGGGRGRPGGKGPGKGGGGA